MYSYSVAGILLTSTCFFEASVAPLKSFSSRLMKDCRSLECSLRSIFLPESLSFFGGLESKRTIQTCRKSRSPLSTSTYLFIFGSYLAMTLPSLGSGGISS